MDFYATKYGAAADGKTNDARAIQAAIDAANENGGGRVVLESGKVFYSSSLILKANVDLHLERGARLVASSELASYVRPNSGATDLGTKIEGTPVTLKPSYAFIYALNADNSAISGDGEIDGNAFAFVKRVDKYYVTGDFYPRPTLVYFENCKHIAFSRFIMKNVPFWTLHVAGCDDVLISEVSILNDLDVANSDGIDVDHSKNVRILGCRVVCADDCLCLKTTPGNAEYGATKNVVISSCSLTTTSAAIKFGTEGVSDFENVIVSNCVITDSNRGISIQIRDGGNVKSVLFQNIIISTRRFADYWWGAAEPISITTHNRVENVRSGHVSDIRFSDITCDGENGVLLSGSDGNFIENVRFDKVEVRLSKKTKWKRGIYDLRPGVGQGLEKRNSAGFYMRRAENVTLKDCTVRFYGDDTSDFGEALYAENCKNVRLSDFSGDAASADFQAIVIKE